MLWNFIPVHKPLWYVILVHKMFSFFSYDVLAVSFVGRVLWIDTVSHEFAFIVVEM